MVTDERADEYARITAAVAEWAQGRDDIRGVAVVGSWARGAAAMHSDVDIVVITNEKGRYLGDDGWVAGALARRADIVQTQDWGRYTERRVRLDTGFEVEFGFVSPSWAATDPVDPGTARVVRDGCLVLKDPDALFERVITAVAKFHSPRRPSQRAT